MARAAAVGDAVSGRGGAGERGGAAYNWVHEREVLRGGGRDGRRGSGGESAAGGEVGLRNLCDDDYEWGACQPGIFLALGGAELERTQAGSDGGFASAAGGRGTADCAEVEGRRGAGARAAGRAGDGEEEWADEAGRGRVWAA